MHSRISTVLLLSLLLASPARAASVQAPAQEAKELTPQQVAKQAFPSVVMVSVNDKQGQPLAIGSGFVHSPGIVVTNLHVIEDGGSATIRVVGRKEAHRITGVAKIDERNDLAFLAFDDKSIPALTMAGGQPEIGDEVYAIGNPRGLEGTFSPGIVSGIRTLESDSLLQITAPISHGSSGGPVLNRRGEVAGVAVAAIRDGQNLNFAIPASAIRSAAASLSAPKPLSEALGGSKRATKSVVRSIGGPLASGVKVHSFSFNQGQFHVSLKNELDAPIKNVVVLVIFYEPGGEPVETAEIRLPKDKTIQPGLATRVSGYVGWDVWNVMNPWGKEPHPNEYRVLYFELAD